MTPAEWGLIAIALAITAHALGRFKKAAPIVVFIGIVTVGTTGRLVGILARVLMFTAGLIGKLGAQILGYSAAAIFAAIVAVLIFLFVHHSMPRHSGKGHNFYIAIVLGVLVAAAATPFAALNSLPSTVSQASTSISTGG